MSETFEFKDRVSTNSDHRKLTFIGAHTGLPDSVVVKVERADENVTEAGTPLNAATMNALKESIAASVSATTTAAAAEAAEAAQTAATQASAAAECADKVGVFTTGEVTELYDFFAEVSAWAKAHDHQAKVLLTGNFTRYELSNLQFFGNAKYTFHCSSLRGISISNANKLSIVQSGMSAVDSAPFEFINCSDLRIEDSTISGSRYELSFANCSSVVVKDTKISCGAAAAMTLSDSTQKYNTLTFSHCRFSGGGTHLIDGSGLTNANVTVHLIDCTDEKGNPVQESQIAKGNAAWVVTESAGSIGNFYIDADVSTGKVISAKIAEACAWAEEHKVRANLKIYGTLTHNHFDDLVLKSNINYTFHYETSGRGLEANNISNCSFTECYINCVSTYSALHFNGCTDITVRDSYLINGMGSNTVVGGTRIHFDNCVLSGGTYSYNVVTLQGPFTAGSTVTYTNCVFNNTYETLVNASDNTAGVTLVLDHCLDGNGKEIARESIQAGSARLYLTGDIGDSGTVTANGEMAASGYFYVDADTASADQINAKIAEASAWGEAHSARANLKIGGVLLYAKVNAMVLKSNVDYTLKIKTGGHGLYAENLTNIGFLGCDIEVIAEDGPITLKNCTDVVLRDCKLVNVMCSNTVENCDNVYFDHCVISGGTAYRNTVTVKDTGTAYRRVTFRDCVLPDDYDVMVHASGMTNAAAVAAFYDCVKGDGNYLPAGKILKGAGKICLTSASEI